jgi:hypothetical protein
MQPTPQKVRILEVKPQLVCVQFIATGRIAELSRKSFEYRVDLGLFEVINPEMMPAVF